MEHGHIDIICKTIKKMFHEYCKTSGSIQLSITFLLIQLRCVLSFKCETKVSKLQQVDTVLFYIIYIDAAV